MYILLEQLKWAGLPGRGGVVDAIVSAVTDPVLSPLAVVDFLQKHTKKNYEKKIHKNTNARN